MWPTFSSRRPRGSRSRRPSYKPRLETLEDRCLPTKFTVVSTGDSGTGTLRDCINQVNADASDNGLNPDTIRFNFPTPQAEEILLASALPAVTRPVIIDGYTQPGSKPNTLTSGDNANILIELNGSLTPAGSVGLSITGFSTIRGLDIHGFSGSGISIDGIANQVQGNFLIGNATGVDILVINGPNTSANVVGTDEGVLQIVDNEADGITDAGERNLISGNTSDGVYIRDATGDYVSGNYIGTTHNGQSSLETQNGGAGIRINNAQDTVIGGDPMRANLIAFNQGGGVVVQGDASTGNQIEVNSI
jgi:hypothetical protein